MSDALIIRLGTDPSSIQYLLVDAIGGRLGAVLTGPIAQAAPLAMNRRVIVLVPGTEVIAAEPILPAKNATRLAKLAPYALEEQLATDIDSMHFGIGKRRTDGKTPVAAVLRDRIEGWLAALQVAGIEPDALYSDSSVVPNAATVTLIVDGGLVYVRRAQSDIQSSGLVLDAQPLEDTLHLALGEHAGTRANESADELIVRDLQLYATQADYQQQQDVFDRVRESVPGLQIKLLPEGPLPLFALEAVKGAPVDFLCGPYERKSSFSASFAKWRYAAVLLGIVVLMHLSYSGIRLWQSIRAEREVDTQIREQVLQTLPGVKIADPREARKQFETRLGVLKQGGGRGELLTSLSTLGEALTQAPETRIEALSYRTQTIDLRVTAPNVDALDKIQQATSAAGLTTTIQSATPRDSKVEGRLQLKTGA